MTDATEPTRTIMFHKPAIADPADLALSHQLAADMAAHPGRRLSDFPSQHAVAGADAPQDPAWCWDADDPESAVPWRDRDELAEDAFLFGQDSSLPMHVKTAIAGPDKWAVRIPVEDGDAYEIGWFDSREEAAQARADALAAIAAGQDADDRLPIPLIAAGPV